MSSVLGPPEAIQRFSIRLNVDQYHQLCDAGIVTERTELLSGIVVEKMGKSPLHTWTVAFLSDWLRNLLPSNTTLRVEQPLTLNGSEPEPDLAIVSGSRDDYRTSHPSAARLVIEVAVSTIDLDREKTAIYAAAGIDEYWLVMPERNQLILHRDAQLDSATYAEVLTHGVDDSLTWAGHELKCADLFRN